MHADHAHIATSYVLQNIDGKRIMNGVVLEGDAVAVVGEADVKALPESHTALPFVVDVADMSRRAASMARSHAGLFILSSIPARFYGVRA